MNLAVRLCRDIPAEQRLAGLPLEWPVETIELGDSMDLPQDGQWYLMTTEGLANYKIANHAAYDAWEDAYFAQTPVEIVTQRIKDARDFGMDIIAEYGAMNTLAGLNTTQIMMIMQKLAPVVAALQTGSLYVALSLIKSIAADEVLIKADVQKHFRNKIEDYLGLPFT